IPKDLAEFSSAVDVRTRDTILRSPYINCLTELLDRGEVSAMKADSVLQAIRSIGYLPPIFVVEYIQLIQGDRDAVIGAMIEHRFVKLFSQNAEDLLRACDKHDAISMALLKIGRTEVLNPHVDLLQGLSPEVIKTALAQKDLSFLRLARGRFTAPISNSDEVAVELVALARSLRLSGDESRLVLESFSGLSMRVVDEVLKSPNRGVGLTGLLFNISSFKPECHVQIALRALKDGYGGVLAQKLSQWTNLTVDLQIALIDAGYIQAVFMNASRFQSDLRRSEEIAFAIKRVIEGGDIESVLRVSDRIPRKVLSHLEAECELISYRNDIGVDNIALYQRYRTLRSNLAQREEFVAQVRLYKDQLFSDAPLENRLVESPAFRPTILGLAPNHTGHWVTSSRCLAIGDHSSHCSPYLGTELRPLSVAGTSRFSTPKVESPAIEGAKEVILDSLRAANEIAGAGATLTAGKEALGEYLNKLPAISSRSFADPAAKLVRAVYSILQGETSPYTVRPAALAYLLLIFDLRDHYPSGVEHMVQEAPNPEYARLIEYRDLFDRKIYETARAIWDSVKRNAGFMRMLQRESTDVRASTELKALKDRLLAAGSKRKEREARYIGEIVVAMIHATSDKERLLAVADIVLNSRGRSASLSKQFRALIRDESQTDSEKIDRIKAIARATREDLAKMLSDYANMQVAAEGINLPSFAFADHLTISPDRRKELGKESLENLFVSAFTDLFAPERALIKKALGDFKIEDQGETAPAELEAVFTSNATLPFAYATAGLCISADPFVHNTEGHFGMILRDSETRRWEGACVIRDLARIPEIQDKKILWIAPNPCSSLLYRIDNRLCLKAILDRVTEFARENGFKAIAVADERHMRTNRINTPFEEALDELVAKSETITLRNPIPFSKEPEYSLTKLHVIVQL
ncbi:MAG: hypothetical protein KDD53_00645, partial [Bdellovibrionales bacterium]|nr:hypothetical protein [Bdellovibrionales bacterium]